MTPEEVQVLEDRATELDDDVMAFARESAGPLLNGLLDLEMSEIVRMAWETGVKTGVRGTLHVITADPAPSAVA